MAVFARVARAFGSLFSVEGVALQQGDGFVETLR